MMKLKWLHLLLSGIFIVNSAAFAETIDLPEEELAKESVTAKFDPPYSVKQRNIVTDGKAEFGLYYGWNFTEPIYHQNKLGMNLTFHTDEFAAWTLNFAKWFPGRNEQYTDLLKKFNLDFDRVPNLEYSAWLLYMMKNYYGKMSITKRGVMNVSLFPVFGVGLTKYVHKTYPGVAAGIGTKFYFSKSFSLHAELRFQYAQAPSPFIGNPGGGCANPSVANTCPKPNPGDFPDKWSIANIMDVGVSFLF